MRYTWKEVTLTQTTPAYALTKWTFTGQFSDSYINLLWYGSRHYDPELARPRSPDRAACATEGLHPYCSKPPARIQATEVTSYPPFAANTARLHSPFPAGRVAKHQRSDPVDGEAEAGG